MVLQYVRSGMDGARLLCRENSGYYDSYILGTLTRGLAAIGLWPEPVQPFVMHQSVKSLSARLLALQCNVMSNEAEEHESCSFKIVLYKDIKRLNRAKEPSGVLECHRRHIKEQSEK